MPFRKRVSVGFFTTLGCLLSATCAFSKPSGFYLKAGHALPPVQKNGTFLIESGDHAVIDWAHFSIDQAEHVVFQQLHEKSSVLNRVTGVDQSQLLGKLSSNGKVYLVNPNGILIGPEARIETAGFIASTLDLLDQDLSGGVFSFAGESEESVINQGVIHCPAGDVFLIGKTVESSGQIRTPRGRQGLLSGCEVVIRPTGAPQIRIRSEEEIEAQMLAENPFALAIRHSGELEGEAVYIVAEEGLCEVTGKVKAVQGEKGGQVRILGDQIALFEQAVVDVSGERGGGEILVGGDYQGKHPEIRNAKQVYLGREVKIYADALHEGNGGKVIFWGDEAMIAYGMISAEGGPLGGDGGLVEISSHGGFIPDAAVSTAAPKGKNGLLYLDPCAVTLSAVGSDTNATFAANAYTFSAATATISIGNLIQNLSNGNVTIDATASGSGTASITIAAPITGAGGGTGGTSWTNNNLILIGGNSITVNASSAITWTGTGTLSMSAASGFIAINSSITNSSTSTGFTAMSFTANNLQTYTGAVGFSLATGTTLSTGNVTGGGAISITAFAGSAVGPNDVNGVVIAGTISTIDGNITLNGTGGNGANTNIVNVGVKIGDTASHPGVVRTTGLGNINITGQGAVNSSGGYNYGFQMVSIAGGLVSTNNGSITINATGGGTSGSGNNVGFDMDGLGQITSTGGTISITGTGGTGAGTCHGCRLTGTTSRIQSTTGTINITGVASGTGVSHGISMESSGTPITSTSGPITLTGSTTAGAGSHGVNVSAAWTAGTSNTVTFSSCLGTTNGGNGINIAAAFVASGNVTATSSITGRGAGGIGFAASAGFTSSGGNIAITASATGTTGACHGISLTGGTLSATGTNKTVTLQGTAGASTTAASQGINIAGGTVTTSTSSGNTVTLTGFGAATVGFASHGISISSGAVTTTAGASISLTGTGGASATASHGISLSGTGAISTTTGSGNISLTGTGTGTGANCGIAIGAGTGAIASGTGTITLSGTGSAAATTAGAHGVTVTSAWTTSTSGLLTFSSCTGGSGATSHAVNIGAALTTSGGITATSGITGGTGAGSIGFNVGAAITAGSGFNIAVTASANSSATGAAYGINISGGTLGTSGTGTVTLNGTASTSGTTAYGIYVTSASGKATAVSGNVSLTGAGNSSAVAGVQIDTSGSVTTTSTGTGAISITAASPSTFIGLGTSTISTGSGSGATITFNQPVILTSATTATVTSAGTNGTTFSSTIDGPGGISISSGGAFSTGTVGGTTPLASFTTAGTGSWSVGVNVTTNGSSGITLGLPITALTISPTFLSSGGPVTVSGAISWNTATKLTLIASKNILINAAVTASSASYGAGEDAMDFTASGVGTTAYAGIRIAAGLSTSAGNGGIRLNGTSGSTTGSNSEGILFANGSVTTSSGNINLTGTGGPSSGNNNHGIGFEVVFTNSISATTGNISLTGVGGGSGASTGNMGFQILSNIASITTTTGSISFNGTAGNGTSFGLNINTSTPATPVIRSAGGAISITGTTRLETSVQLDTTNSGGTPTGANISFLTSSSTINGISAGSQTLTVRAGTAGAITFEGAIGASTRLAGLTITSAKTTANAINIGGNITSNAFTISTASPVTLTAASIIDTSSGNGAISFPSTVDGTSGLTLTSGSGAITFTGAVGGATPLGAISVTSTNASGVTIGSNITATSFTAASTTTAVFSGATSTISTSGVTGIFFGGTINGTVAGSQAVTLTATGGGSVTFSGNVGATRLGALTIGSGGGGLSIGTAVTSIAANSFTVAGAVPTTLNNTGTLTIDTSGFNGDILFQGTINGSTAGMQPIALTAGTGTVTLSQAVGGSTGLGAFSVTASQINPAGDISTKAGMVTLTGPVTLAGDLTLSSAIGSSTGADITFSSTITGAQALTIAAGSAGVIRLGGSVGTSGTPLTSLNLSGALLRLGNDIYTDGGPLTISMDTVLTGSPTINTGNQDLTFSGTIEGTNTSEQNLTLQAGTGAITLSDTIGGTIRLGDVNIAAASGLSLGSSVRANSLSIAAPTPTTLSLVGLTTIDTTGDISFGGTLKGTHDGEQLLTLLAGSGNITFSDTVGVGKRLGALTVSTAAGVSLPDTVIANSVTISSPIPTTLSASTTLIDTSAVNGSITLGGAVAGTVAGAQALTLTPGAGSITLGNAVGLGTALGAISIPSVNNLTASSSIIASSLTQTTGSGTSTFNGELALSGALSLTGNNFTINRPVSATNVTLVNTGDLSIGSSGDMDLTGAFAQSGGGTIQTAGSITTAGGNIHWTDAVELRGNVVFDTGESTGEIRFYSTVDGGYGLRLFANEVQFDDVVGGTTAALNSLRVTAETITLGGDQTVASGPMLYDGSVVLTSDTTLTDSGSIGMSFQQPSASNSTPSISGNYDLTLLSLNTSLTVEGDIDLSGTSGSAGGNLVATASTALTCEGQILTQGGSASPGTGGTGGNVSLTCSAGSISVHNINASGGDGTVATGNGGNIILQPSSGYSGDYPLGVVILNEDLSLNQDGNLVSVAGSGGGTAGSWGTVTISANRSSPAKVATVVSGSSGNDVFITAGSLTMGTYEAITILGDLLIMCNTVSLGDAVALDALVILSIANNLHLHDPYDILDNTGSLYSSPTLHYLGGSDYLRVGTPNPIDNNLNGQNLELSSSTFRPLLFYNGHILNYDTSSHPTPTVFSGPIGLQQFALYQLGIADAQLSDLLPIYLSPLPSPYTLKPKKK